MTTPSLIIVPARGGSTRIPGKNLRPLAGKSLLEHTGDAIKASGLDAPVLLTTDDDAIAAEGEQLGWMVPFRRPDALATAAATTISTILHVLDWYNEVHGQDPGTVMVLQPTSPLRGGQCLVEAVRQFDAGHDIDSVIAMKMSHLPPSRLYQVDENGVAEAVGAGADGAVYEPNGAIYLSRVESIRKEGTLYAGRILPLVMDTIRSIDIDTEDDWRLAEAALAAGLPVRAGADVGQGTGKRVNR